MHEYIVHTQRRGKRVAEPDQMIHFFYRVSSSCADTAFARLQVCGAIDPDEVHVETFPIPEADKSYELLAIFRQ